MVRVVSVGLGLVRLVLGLVLKLGLGLWLELGRTCQGGKMSNGEMSDTRCYLFTVSNTGLLFFQHADIGFPNFIFTFN